MLFEAFVSLLAATRTTEFAARVSGVRTFLPVLSTNRFSTVGGIDEKVFARQLDECKSFQDARWTKYWIALAAEQLQRLDAELKAAGIEQTSEAFVSEAAATTPPTASPALVEFLRRGAETVTKTPPGQPIVAAWAPEEARTPEKSSSVALAALLQAIAYYFAAAWPGRTPLRQKAYRTCERIFDLFLDVVAPTLDLKVERHFVKTSGEEVKVYALLPTNPPQGAGVPLPGILVSNGLEGTNVETMTVAIRTQATVSNAWFVMEMPGTYAYAHPMSKASSEQIYSDVLSFMAAHEGVDGDRLGMIGISFGGNAATRMAIADKRIKAVAINGAPLGRSLGPSGSFGMPEVIVRVLLAVFGAKTLLHLKSSLHSITPSKAEIEGIQAHVLAINGDRDTLIATKDTTDLAEWAPNSELLLYKDDDHCAMGHIREWLEYGAQWFEKKL